MRTIEKQTNVKNANLIILGRLSKDWTEDCSIFLNIPKRKLNTQKANLNRSPHFHTYGQKD